MLNDQTLFFGLPIKLDENVTLYQPTLNEMIEQGFMIENILEPFITLDKRNFENEENKVLTSLLISSIPRFHQSRDSRGTNCKFKGK